MREATEQYKREDELIRYTKSCIKLLKDLQELYEEQDRLNDRLEDMRKGL